MYIHRNTSCWECKIISNWRRDFNEFSYLCWSKFSVITLFRFVCSFWAVWCFFRLSWPYVFILSHFVIAVQYVSIICLSRYWFSFVISRRPTLMISPVSRPCPPPASRSKSTTMRKTKGYVVRKLIIEVVFGKAFSDRFWPLGQPSVRYIRWPSEGAQNPH